MPLELTPQQPPYYEIASGPAPAGTKYYTAVMNQAGTAAPTAIIQQNTLSGTLVWTRLDVGDYEGTLAGEFTANKTWCIISGGDGVTYKISRGGANTISIQTFDSTPAFADDILIGISIEIRVYP